MLNLITKFSGLLTIVLGIVFAIHLSILKYLGISLFGDRIIAAYLINLILAIIIYGAMLRLRNKYESQLGFIFMFGSALKFIIFFIYFYPFYKADGTISKLEFTAFFVPYVICLIIETSSLSKWLNKLG
jgi:hypothetical protein